MRFNDKNLSNLYSGSANHNFESLQISGVKILFFSKEFEVIVMMNVDSRINFALAKDNKINFGTEDFGPKVMK